MRMLGRLVLVLSLGLSGASLLAGCGADQGGGATGPMVKDAPPATGEMTTDDFMKQQNARTKPR